MVRSVCNFRGVAEARRETSLDFHSPPAEPSRGPTFPRLEDESVGTNFARRCAAIFTRPQHNQKLWPCTWSVWWQVPARCFFSLNHIVSPWTLLQSPSRCASSRRKYGCLHSCVGHSFRGITALLEDDLPIPVSSVSPKAHGLRSRLAGGRSR
jgi:hypothetical protein